MSLDSLPVVLSYSGGPNGPGRRPRRLPIDLIVVHTNEGGAAEPLTGAEGLSRYTAAPHPPDYPAYHVVVDGDSAVRTAHDGDKVNGAGGVNEHSWHICLYGTAAQTPAQWHDAYSRGELDLAAALVSEACERFHLPVRRDPTLRLGICAHGDVSALHSESQGHTDPGPNFPWVEFLELVAHGPTTTPPASETPVTAIYYPHQNQQHSFWLQPSKTDPTVGFIRHAWQATIGSGVETLSVKTEGGCKIAQDLAVYVNGVDGSLNVEGVLVDGALLRFTWPTRDTGWAPKVLGR